LKHAEVTVIAPLSCRACGYNLSVLWHDSALPLRNQGSRGKVQVDTGSVRRDLYRAAGCTARGWRKRTLW